MSLFFKTLYILYMDHNEGRVRRGIVDKVVKDKDGGVFCYILDRSDVVKVEDVLLKTNDANELDGLQTAFDTLFARIKDLDMKVDTLTVALAGMKVLLDEKKCHCKEGKHDVRTKSTTCQCSSGCSGSSK